MDQQAFRQLISTPRHDDSSQALSSKPRLFGKQNKAVAKESPRQAAELIPRKIGGGSSKASSSSSTREKPPVIHSATGETYVDRAEARRLGVDGINESDDIEALKREYEQRIEEAEDEDERENLREKIEQLRGDTKHPAVAKGLDYALLAQQKAKLNGSGDVKEIDDDDLEEAYGSGGIEIKEEETTIDVPVASKFKPIGSSAGFKPIGKEDEGQPEYIWRDGKRLRKKKKKPVVVENGTQEESSRRGTISQDAGEHHPGNGRQELNSKKAEMKLLKEQSKIVAAKEKADRERAVMPPPRIIPSSSPKVAIEARVVKEESSESEDDSTDIFADAGRWNGLDDDGSEEGSEEGEAISVVPVPQASSSGKRDWFNIGKNTEREEGEAEEVALPSSLSSILDNVHDAKKKHEAEDVDPGSDGEEEERESKPQRLEGLSDSILGREGMRYMLEKKDDDRNDRQRKRKRSKKGKGGYGSD